MSCKTIPHKFLCPISHEVMKDPVGTLPCGTVFERKQIEEWFKKSSRHPTTNKVLSAAEKKSLIPIRHLREEIEEWREKSQKLVEIFDFDNPKPEVELKRLLEAGAYIDYIHEDDCALARAIACKNKAAVLYLLEMGANVNLVLCKEGFTPVYDACCASLEYIKLLFQHGANMNHSLYDGRNFLHVACGVDQFEIADFLIEEVGISIHSKDNEGMTPIFCCQGNCTTQLEAFVARHKPDINHVSDNNCTILHQTSGALIACALKLGVDERFINQKCNGNTPLHWVKDEEGAKLLLLHGANPDEKNNDGLTPLQHFTARASNDKLTQEERESAASIAKVIEEHTEQRANSWKKVNALELKIKQQEDVIKELQERLQLQEKMIALETALKDQQAQNEKLRVNQERTEKLLQEILTALGKDAEEPNSKRTREEPTEEKAPKRRRTENGTKSVQN